MNLKKLRIKYNLTQAELAHSLHVSESIISRWENHSRFPSFQNLSTIADFFNLSIGQLIDN